MYNYSVNRFCLLKLINELISVFDLIKFTLEVISDQHSRPQITL